MKLSTSAFLVCGLVLLCRAFWQADAWGVLIAFLFIFGTVCALVESEGSE